MLGGEQQVRRAIAEGVCSAPALAAAIGAHLDACAACCVEFDIAMRVRAHVAHQHQALAPLLEAGSEQRSFARLCRGLK